MAATGMKMKQAGLIEKPMYVVPNHLLEQFSREFIQLYPNARSRP
jgi:N12 class adenine-specific DNA methylase